MTPGYLLSLASMKDGMGESILRDTEQIRRTEIRSGLAGCAVSSGQTIISEQGVVQDSYNEEVVYFLSFRFLPHPLLPHTKFKYSSSMIDCISSIFHVFFASFGSRLIFLRTMRRLLQFL